MELADNLRKIKTIILNWNNARYCSIIGLILVNIYVSIKGEIPPALLELLNNNSGGNYNGSLF